MPLKVEVVGVYNGVDRKWAIARFPIGDEEPALGFYRIGLFVKDGISFNSKDFSSRENAEAFLVYNLDTSVKF